MRRRFAELLPDLATIERPTATYDGSGGFATTWASLATTVPCRLSPVGGGEDDEGRGGERLTEDATSIITFKWNQDIAEADRATVNGQAYDIQLVRRRGEYAMTLRVEARETI